MTTEDITTEELAELAKCAVSTVKRAIQAKEIPEARKGIVKNSVAWLIPREAGEKWARGRVPFATQKAYPRDQRGRITANKGGRTPPASESIPVTRDERPLNNET